MTKAQGALEYLIIIAAVLGISAVVVLFVTGVFTGSSSGAGISGCRMAASNCGKDLTLGVGTSCQYCEAACKDATGKEVIAGAITACKAGRVSSIAAGFNATVGLVNDSSCICGWTVGSNCLDWWKQKLLDRGFNVESVYAATLSDVNSMKKYKAILSPYGEFYLDYGADQSTTLNNTREYVSQGGYWFEYGGYPFYYKCSAGSAYQGPYSSGSKMVCISITGPNGAILRNITSYGRSVSPNGPSAISGNSRSSAGNDFSSNASCIPLASGSSYNPLYLNISAPLAGPAAHCYGSGCIIRSDLFIPSTSDDIVTIYADFLRSKVF